MDNDLYLKFAHEATIEYFRQCRGSTAKRHDEFMKDYVCMVEKTMNHLKTRLSKPD